MGEGDGRVSGFACIYYGVFVVGNMRCEGGVRTLKVGLIVVAILVVMLRFYNFKNPESDF